ncbi:MAG: family 16 glycoside hydrolase, partial [Verrucomicrobiales bacterium]
MKKIILSSLFIGSFILNSSAEEGFASVFDGKNKPDVKKDGSWTTFTGKGMSVKTEGNWIPQEDGSLFLDPRPGEKGWTRYGSYLWLTEDYKDFVFDFEYKHGKGGNSGL